MMLLQPFQIVLLFALLALDLLFLPGHVGHKDGLLFVGDSTISQTVGHDVLR